MDKKPTLRHPQSFINGLEKTNEFLGDLARGKSRRVSIGHAAALHHERMSHTESQTPEKKLDQAAVRILASLPAFVDAQRALDKLEDQERRNGHHFPKNVRLPHLKAVIPYNHALLDLIDTFPGIDAESVWRFSGGAMLDLGGRADAEFVEMETRELLHGLRNEIGLEQILWQIDDVSDVTRATEEQELIGIDRGVVYRRTPLFLDAKASEFGAQKALQAHQDYLRFHHLTEADDDGGYPVYTGLTDDDFHGGFRISQEKAEECAPAIKRVLDELYAIKSHAA